MKKLTLILIIGLTWILKVNAKEENEYYVDYLKKCSAANVEEFSLKDNEVTIFKSSKLNLPCLKEKFLIHLETFPVDFNQAIIRENKKINDILEHERVKITSLYSQRCGENCVTNDEIILIQDNNYLYVRGFGDRGVEAKILDKDNVLIQNLMTTHVRNYLFNLKDKKFTSLPNGYLEFYKNYILVKQQKSYFNPMGAFWFNSKINYLGEIIELISDGKTCEPINSFRKNIQLAMKKSGLNEFCVTTY